jgi:hypothetical protein
MKFTNGDNCGNEKYSTNLDFWCDTENHIKHISIQNCESKIIVGTPAACVLYPIQEKYRR